MYEIVYSNGAIAHSNVMVTDALYGIEYISHHGVKGMHWYQRLYQNKDGTLTELGRRHYSSARTEKSLNKKNEKLGGELKSLQDTQKGHYDRSAEFEKTSKKASQDKNDYAHLAKDSEKRAQEMKDKAATYKIFKNRDNKKIAAQEQLTADYKKRTSEAQALADRSKADSILAKHAAEAMEPAILNKAKQLAVVTADIQLSEIAKTMPAPEKKSKG